MPKRTALQKVEAAARKRRIAMRQVELDTEALVERMREARSEFTMDQIAEAAGMKRQNAHRLAGPLKSD